MLAGGPIAARDAVSEDENDSRRLSPGHPLRACRGCNRRRHRVTAPAELARVARQAAPDAIIIVDALGMSVFANAQWCALFGYARGGAW